MKALIISHGSRGDFQPFVALARGLVMAGHEVVLGVPPAAVPLAQPYDIEIFQLTDRSHELAAIPRFRHLARPSYYGLGYLTEAIHLHGHLLACVLDEIAIGAEGGADVIVHNPAIHGHQVAERLGIPSVAAYPLPALVSTGAFPNPMFPFRLPQVFNRSTYSWTRLMARAIFGGTARWRKEVLRLPPRHGYADALHHPDGAPTTVLYAFSPHLLPSPPGYPDSVQMTGFWFLPSPPGWKPSPDLCEFLAAGPKPVYFGFASRPDTNPRQAGNIVMDAARLAGVRALVVAGSGGGIRLEEPTEDIFLVDDAPFDWLFPRVAAVVHHGGVGTTGAALAASRPQVICPLIPSQRFVAACMYTKGVASGPLEPGRLTPENLAEAIRHAITDRELADHALDLGHQIRLEDGISDAVATLEIVAAST